MVPQEALPELGEALGVVRITGKADGGMEIRGRGLPACPI
jgi:hypothetical protein